MAKSNFGPNVTALPVYRVADGLVWFGGRSFKTMDDLYDALSFKEIQRAIAWESRNMTWLAPEIRRNAHESKLNGTGCQPAKLPT
jgi:hypothetical protein